VETLVERYQEIGAAEVREAAERYLTPKHQCVVTLVPTLLHEAGLDA
jgi:hypothetical protein